MKNKKKQVTYFLLIVFILSVSLFAIVSYFNKGNDVKNLSLKYNSVKSVKITNKLPISDTLGKNIDENTDIKSFVEFSVKNPNDKAVDFEIYITKKNSIHDIRDSYVKFYLTDDADNALNGFTKNKIPSYKDLGSLNDKPASRLLYKGNIAKNATNNYKLRVWISDSYGLNDELEEFYANIGVRIK